MSSNFERFAWYMSFNSFNDKTKACEKVSEWMTQLKRDGCFEMDQDMMEHGKLKFLF